MTKATQKDIHTRVTLFLEKTLPDMDSDNKELAAQLMERYGIHYIKTHPQRKVMRAWNS